MLLLPWIVTPPEHKITSCKYSHFLSHLGSKCIIGDDFDAKHPYQGSHIITTKGWELWQSIVTTNDSCLSNGKPTYCPSDQSPDCIDFFISRAISANYMEINNIDDLSSTFPRVCTYRICELFQKFGIRGPLPFRIQNYL